MQNCANAITKERNSTHGSFKNNARVAQLIRSALASGNRWGDLSDVQKESLGEISLKLSRIVTGDPNHLDNWVDIQGYANLAEQELRTGNTL